MTDPRPNPNPPTSSKFWIDLVEAERSVQTLLEVASEERDERPVCVVLSGPSGMGKTFILKEAQRRIELTYPKPLKMKDTRYTPMLRAIVPAKPSSKKINQLLLWHLGWPLRTNSSIPSDFKVVDLVRLQQTRLISIDQIHTILLTSGVARRDTLDAFRFLMSETQLPMVFAGIERAADIFEADEELAARSISIKLHPWGPGAPIQSLILAMAKGLQLVEPERLAGPEMASLIWNMSRGITGNVARILHWASKVARNSGSHVVTADHLRASVDRLTPYTPGR